MAWWVPAGAVLGLLLKVADKRSACVPTWVVLTCCCRDGTEVGVCERGRTGAAFTGGEHKELDPQGCCVKFPGVPVLRDLVAVEVASFLFWHKAHAQHVLTCCTNIHGE